MELPPSEPCAGQAAAAVLIPVKSFRSAKLRLAPALPPAERAALAQRMASRVVASSGDLPVAVVCDDTAVARWARDLGAMVLWEPGRGLDSAVGAGVSYLAGAGAERVIVAHGDLPFASALAAVDVGNGVTIVPDRREDGTNVLAIPARAGVRFSYGPGSFQRHVAEAERLGLDVHIVHDPLLSFDVDMPADLAELTGASGRLGERSRWK